MKTASSKGHKKNNRIIFLWNNFGPMHADRVDAVSRGVSGVECIGVELFETDKTYEWISESRNSFKKVTLFSSKEKVNFFSRAGKLLALPFRWPRAIWFLCHYERAEIFILAVALRLSGHRVFTMIDSKFDDYPRSVFREILKSIFVLPYSGALACGERSRDYIRFLGVAKDKIFGEYDTLSIERIRNLSEAPIAPDGVPFLDRDFVIVARHVGKKNIHTALHAYKMFLDQTGSTRKLHLCGSGPLTAEYLKLTDDLGIKESVIFHGFLQTENVAKILAKSLVLILPSLEEQFGLVVIEAQSVGLPVLVSVPCGARDHLVRNWVNGFIFEPDNAIGLSKYMEIIDENEMLWRELCLGAQEFSVKGDVQEFVKGVTLLARITD